MKTGFTLLLAVLLPTAPAVPGHATVVHLMQIEQIVGGVDGDSTIQAIQLRMRSPFQNLMQFSQTRVWDSAGLNPIVVQSDTVAVVNHGLGVRILITSPNFVTRTTPAAAPDFIMNNLIPASYLAAGSITFESNLGTVVWWRISWGGAAYTGPTTGQAALGGNDADGEFGPPFAGPLISSDVRALQFPGSASAPSTNNVADYALTPGNSEWVNNVGDMFTVEPIPTGIEPLPLTALSQNFPNPFNPTTEIVFNMARAGRAALRIYDGQGKLIITLLDGSVPQGENRVTWDGRDTSGKAMATGVYFYRLVTGNGVQARKMMLLK